MAKDHDKEKTKSLSLKEEQGNLLYQALHGLSEEQHRELMGKAAEEALRVQSDAAKRDVKSNAAFRDVHEHVNAVNKLSTDRSLSGHHVKSEIETGSGKMTISSRKGPGCFIATVVFESESAPEVISLRRFRDHVLAKSGAGRCFIGWYYRHGPAIARWVEGRPKMKRAARFILVKVERLLRNRQSKESR